jgi:hypothetical protein
MTEDGSRLLTCNRKTVARWETEEDRSGLRRNRQAASRAPQLVVHLLREVRLSRRR